MQEYQTLLSAWTVKVAMINDAVESHDRFFTRTECEAFRLNKMYSVRTYRLNAAD